MILYIFVGYIVISLGLYVLMCHETGESDIYFAFMWPLMALLILAALLWVGIQWGFGSRKEDKINDTSV